MSNTAVLAPVRGSDPVDVVVGVVLPSVVTDPPAAVEVVVAPGNVVSVMPPAVVTVTGTVVDGDVVDGVVVDDNGSDVVVDDGAVVDDGTLVDVDVDVDVVVGGTVVVVVVVVVVGGGTAHPLL